LFDVQMCTTRKKVLSNDTGVTESQIVRDCLLCPLIKHECIGRIFIELCVRLLVFIILNELWVRKHFFEDIKGFLRLECCIFQLYFTELA